MKDFVGLAFFVIIMLIAAFVLDPWPEEKVPQQDFPAIQAEDGWLVIDSKRVSDSESVSDSLYTQPKKSQPEETQISEPFDMKWYMIVGLWLAILGIVLYLRVKLF